MCCSLEHPQGLFRVESAVMLEDKKHVKVTGYLDHTPKNFSERCARIFQRVELAEKIAEVADEAFHLFKGLLKTYASPEIYEFFLDMHHGAHHLESFLHAICFFGDVNRFVSWLVIDKREMPQGVGAYLKTAARVVHTVSHFFATVDFLNRLKICHLTHLMPFIKYKEVISALGYSLWAVALIYERCIAKKNNAYFASDLSIHLGGAAFEIFKYIEEIVDAPIIMKLAALAGIIHAGHAASRLMPLDKEPVEMIVHVH